MFVSLLIPKGQNKLPFPDEANWQIFLTPHPRSPNEGNKYGYLEMIYIYRTLLLLSNSHTSLTLLPFGSYNIRKEGKFGFIMGRFNSLSLK
jgi:hypothetical protein